LTGGCARIARRAPLSKLKSYGAARRHLLPDVEHRQSRYLTDIFDKPFSSVGANLMWHG
jgi:hypothetical protein